MQAAHCLILSFFQSEFNQGTLKAAVLNICIVVVDRNYRGLHFVLKPQTYYKGTTEDHTNEVSKTKQMVCRERSDEP